ncbi:hypothetical protein [Haloplanus halobius]|uniref:hypothetical protein n=1 Tax=Haloplanus halobius TaxID=2934938 RepID=UPI00200EE3AF|nr:hypothetical protein [Haloplanus sp. XH21]
MNRSRLLTALLVSAIVGSCLVAPLTSVGAAQSTADESEAYVSIGNVSVSPQYPGPDEQVTVTATFRNSANSGGAAKLTEASLRGPGVSRRSSADNLGDLGPGDSIEVPFSTTFEETGQKRLTVVLRGHGPDGSVFVVERPVYVTVEESSGISLAFSPVFDADPAAGAETPINVTLANGDSEAVTGIQLELNGSGTVEDPQRVKGSIGAGSEQTFQYDVTFDGTGTQTLSGDVTYTTSEGMRRTATKSADIEVSEPDISAGLTARSATDGSVETNVELTNFGNAAFSDVEVVASAGGDVVARNLMEDVDPDSSRSVRFDVPSSVDGTVTYTATYTAAGTTHTTAVQDQSAVSGEIRLVSVATSRSGAGVTLQGDAANIGSTTAESVLLRVVDTDDVDPTAPVGEYYVGEIEGSEFGTFELSAETGSNASTIPVEVTYVVDGDRVTSIQRIDIASISGSSGQAATGGSDEQAAGEEQGPPSDGGPPILGIGIAVLVVIAGAVGFGIRRWRSQ